MPFFLSACHTQQYVIGEREGLVLWSSGQLLKKLIFLGRVIRSHLHSIQALFVPSSMNSTSLHTALAQVPLTGRIWIKGKSCLSSAYHDTNLQEGYGFTDQPCQPSTTLCFSAGHGQLPVDWFSALPARPVSATRVLPAPKKCKGSELRNAELLQCQGEIGPVPLTDIWQ